MNIVATFALYLYMLFKSSDIKLQTGHSTPLYFSMYLPGTFSSVTTVALPHSGNETKL